MSGGALIKIGINGALKEENYVQMLKEFFNDQKLVANFRYMIFAVRKSPKQFTKHRQTRIQ